MKKILIIIVTIIGSFFYSCEKDDICDDNYPTTPNMVVDFYDNASPSTKKNITDLALLAEGEKDTIWYNNVSTIKIPLKTNQNNVSYFLVTDAKNKIISLRNIDKVQINYTRKDIYLSRACGFKTEFLLNQNPNGCNVIPDNSNWIKEAKIEKFSIENEKETHVKIYF